MLLIPRFYKWQIFKRRIVQSQGDKRGGKKDWVVISERLDPNPLPQPAYVGFGMMGWVGLG